MMTRHAPYLAVLALAVLGLGACDRLPLDSAPPPPLVMSFSFSSAIAEATAAELYDQANRLAIRVVDAETESVLADQVQDFAPSSDETRVQVNLTLEEDETPIRFSVELRDGTTPLLRGVGSATLITGSTSQVDVELRAGERRTITFDELPRQSVHGLSFAGVNFFFEVGGQSSSDAFFNSGGPGSITHVQDPSLEGTTDGILTLTFDAPTPVLEFGVAINVSQVLSPGVIVELLGPDGDLIERIAVTTSPLVSFTEARVRHEGALVGTAVIDFQPPFTTRFALDNLTFDGFAQEALVVAGLERTPVETTSNGQWHK